MEVVIKRITANEVNAVAFLFNEYRQFYQQPPDLESAAAFLKDRLSRNESVVFIAYVDGAATGFMQLYPIFSSVGLKPAWLLNDLYVAADFRKAGVGSALIEAAKQLGCETNAGWLLLQTAADNFTAQSVYEKNGWIKETDYFYRLDL